MSENHIPEHSSLIKTPKQLVIVVVLSFILPVAIIVMMVQLVTGSKKSAPPTAASEEAIAQRIKPVGEVVIAAAGGALQTRTGQAVVEGACAACHATGALNAPKIGDAAAWGKLIPRGLDALAANAIKGVRQMPARGGNPDLTDFEVARAIVHMANQSGGNLKEPAAPADPSPTAVVASATVATLPAAAVTAAGANPAKGKAIYEATCAACHSAGVAGAPKAGDKAAWGPRLKTGNDALVASVTKGKGIMPPKGGNASLSDADVRAAVEYLTGPVK